MEKRLLRMWMGKRLFSLALALLVALSTIPPAFASSTTTAGGTFFTDSDNWNGNSAGNGPADDDLDVFTQSERIKNGDAKYPFDFKITGVDKTPQQSAYLLIRGYDVDEYDSNDPTKTGEWDRVYMSANPDDVQFTSTPYTNWPTSGGGAQGWSTASANYKKEFKQSGYIGALSGNDNKWNTTVLKLDPATIVSGNDYYVGISIHHHYKNLTYFNSGWVATIDWGQIVVDGGVQQNGEITKLNMKVENGKVTVDTAFMPKNTGNFSIEANVVQKNADGSDNNLATDKKLFDGASAGTEQTWSNLVLSDSSIDPSKEYEVNIILFDDRGNGTSSENYTNPGKVEHIYSVSSFDPKVSDIAKKGLQYEPTGFTSADFKNKFSKLNGTANGDNLQHIQIKSLPDASKGKLVLTDSTGTITSNVYANDVILTSDISKLTFIPANSGFTGTASFTWNGYDIVKEKYALLDANVSLTANAAPVVADFEKLTNEGDTVQFTAADFANPKYSDADLEPLNNVKIVTLPTRGTLKLNGATVVAGQVIPAAQLGLIAFVPEPDQTGTVTFTWNGSDGSQYAQTDKTITIKINTPPVVSDIIKPSLTGAVVSFSADDFINKYTDVNTDPMQKIKITLPSGFDQKGKLWFIDSVTGIVYLNQSAPVQELDISELPSLKFEPDINLPSGSTVAFKWDGYDGIMYSASPANVTITYNGKPVADPVSVSAVEGTTPITIELSGSDAETVTGLVYSIKTQPSKGTLTPVPGSGNKWTYTPNPEFTGGVDSFTYTVTDADGQESVSATVTIQINKLLDGWVGVKDQGDTTIVKALLGQPLKLSAVSSLDADQVTATVNGTAVALTLTNAASAQLDGYKQWAKTNYILPLETSPGTYQVTFEASKADVRLPNEIKLADNSFEVIGAKLKLTAEPAKIIGDGNSLSYLTAVLKDVDGNPIVGVEVVFSVPAGVGNGSFPESDRAVTDAQGKAVVKYQSSKITGVDEKLIPVVATVQDAVKGLYAQDQLVVSFLPASISGMITKGDDNTPVPNAQVRITLDLNNDGIIDPAVDFVQTVFTDANGNYSIIVPKGDVEYDLEFTQDVLVGGVPTPVSYKQKAHVGSVTGVGDENFTSEKTVTGVVLFKQPDGKTTLFNNDMIGKTKVYVKDSSGNYIMDGGIKKGFTLQDQGVFRAEGLAVGDYTLEISYELEPGQEIIISRGDVKVKANGELNITEELVDPYGTITDAISNQVISGAQVTLYYADTTRNKNHPSRTPNTGVVLPVINGFDPNNNASPGQISDSSGFYAYMVYPQADYYLVVSKNGYETYRSSTIPVEFDIVKHDVKLYPEQSSGGGSAPSPSNVLLNLSVNKNLVEEGTQSNITVNFKNDSLNWLNAGHVKITLPEGVVLVDADGGVVEGNTIAWPVENLSAGQTKSFEISVKWPQINKEIQNFDIPSLFYFNASPKDEKAHSNVNVQVFSKRFGDLEHQRYILGYPDGQFKPDRSLTRAELAAIVARLTENNNLTDALSYSDVKPDHWASNYIRIVTKHSYFNGFEDGTFHPEAPVTRAELAAVMTRFLKISLTAPTELHFNDVKGNWAASAVEQLYRSNYISGYPDGSYKPQNSIIRSEAVTLINRMLYRGPLKGLNAIFPDMPESHWAFGDVQEATQSHSSVRNTDGSESWTKNLNDDVK